MLSLVVAFNILLVSTMAIMSGLILMDISDLSSLVNLFGRVITSAGLIAVWVAFVGSNIFPSWMIFVHTVILLFFSGLFHTKEFRPAV